MKIVLDLQGAQSESSQFRGIGRYSLALARAIARESRGNEVWLALNGRYPKTVLTLRDSFSDLIPGERIRVFELPGPVAELDPRNGWRMQAAELLREKFLSDLHPDIVHISTLFEGFQNEVVTSVGRLANDVPSAVTLYDVIPMLHPERFLPDAVVRRCYLRRAQSLKRADVLLAISESTRREAIEVFDIAPERIVTIGAGLAESLRTGVDLTSTERTRVATRYGLHRPFVLYTGAVDPHKNVEGLIAAFAMLPDQLKRAHHLVFAGKLREEDRKRLSSLARQHGLGDDFFCLGYVPDADLRLLYGLCEVFVLPSLHEGFGLPVLEAMACGAPAIASNRASMPEIVNRDDILFDPLQPREIADRVVKVLSDPGFRQNLKNWGTERAKAFTWEKCAGKALDAFEDVCKRHRVQINARVKVGTKRAQQTLAFVSPLTPNDSQIAGHAVRLLPDLSRHYEIVCITENLEVTDPWLSANFEIRDAAWFEGNTSRFDRIVYQLGKHSFSTQIFALLQQNPGIVVLHDFHLGELFIRKEESGEANDCFVKILYGSHGFSALERHVKEGREMSLKAYPCNAAILSESIGIIVHTEETMKQLSEWNGTNESTPIRHIPIPEFCERRLSDSTNNTREGARDSRPGGNREEVAKLYKDTIEEMYNMSSQSRELDLLRSISRIGAAVAPTKGDLAGTALAIDSNRVRFGDRQILVDVTILARSDARTGIQRVTRAILMALIASPPKGYRIEPVRVSEGKYFYARRFACRCLSMPEDTLSDDQVETRIGDIFLGLDLCFEFVPDTIRWFELQRCRGVAINFVVYDILTQLRPELFYPHIPPLVRKWFETLADVADGLLCISQTVADEVAGWLSKLESQRKRPLSINFFHLGADLHASLPTTGLTSDASAILNSVKSRPSFLMVGSMEPRKGYRQAVAAMNKLWQSGLNANLVIAGKPGWLMEDFEKELRIHPETGKRLLWLEEVSDEMLEQIYRCAAALLVTSEGEGFGLPLIEAAQFGLPIIARDLPVFCEVAGEYAYYFKGNDAGDLADALRRWLDLGDDIPKSENIRRLTWQQSSRQLLDALLGKRPYRWWPDPAEIQELKTPQTPDASQAVCISEANSRRK
jgi:glycosyltransferase involved in cell wall biosynthesis